MKAVRISADLEKQIRSGQVSGPALRDAIIALLDAPTVTKSVGLSYKELLTLFNSHLGERLALPPKPNAIWIIRQVNKAKELGLDAESIREICNRAGAKYPRGPIELEFLLRTATRLLAEAGGVAETPGAVHTGRGAQDGK